MDGMETVKHYGQLRSWQRRRGETKAREKEEEGGGSVAHNESKREKHVEMDVWCAATALILSNVGNGHQSMKTFNAIAVLKRWAMR